MHIPRPYAHCLKHMKEEEGTKQRNKNLRSSLLLLRCCCSFSFLFRAGHLLPLVFHVCEPDHSRRETSLSFRLSLTELQSSKTKHGTREHVQAEGRREKEERERKLVCRSPDSFSFLCRPPHFSLFSRSHGSAMPFLQHVPLSQSLSLLS